MQGNKHSLSVYPTLQGDLKKQQQQSSRQQPQSQQQQQQQQRGGVGGGSSGDSEGDVMSHSCVKMQPNWEFFKKLFFLLKIRATVPLTKWNMASLARKVLSGKSN